MTSKSTCLAWGPKSGSLADLWAFQQEIALVLDTTRRKAHQNAMYAQLVLFYEAELIRVSDELVERQRREEENRPCT